MNQDERRLFLIEALMDELDLEGTIPEEKSAQERLLRGLFNIRPPRKASDTFLSVQDAYLKEEIKKKGITDVNSLKPLKNDIYLWQGDITTLKCDGIVNAANSGMTGCYVPNHGCIDNAIHTYSGVNLREECARIMENQGHPEETGRAKITDGYNLPASHVIHTVGPIVSGELTEEDEKLLASSYRSALELADKEGLKSIAFCCISTGEFHFPNERAAEIAVETVERYKKNGSKIKVIFNVFKDEDYEIYERVRLVHKLKAYALARQRIVG